MGPSTTSRSHYSSWARALTSSPAKRSKPALQCVAFAGARCYRGRCIHCLRAGGAPGLRERPCPRLGDRGSPVHGLRRDGHLCCARGLALVLFRRGSDIGGTRAYLASAVLGLIMLGVTGLLGGNLLTEWGIGVEGVTR